MSTAQVGLLLYGAGKTILLTLGGMALALLIAFPVGLARVSHNKFLRAIGFTYVELFRGAAVLVLAFWFVYALPSLGWQLDPTFAGILALGLNMGAYSGEVVRGAIQAVPAGQVEAATALNFKPSQGMRRIVLPQAIRAMIPSFGNNVIEQLKATAVVAVVSIPELTFNGQLIWSGNGRAAAVFGGLLIGYGLMALIFMTGVRLLERKVAWT
ncbi:ectoine/hydroxyectoine ABC transporter permease subunit EhuC [Kibdelosporangium phytohabitans]|uniref:Amino acid ABC transporter permease n=1 Tax=Kibdelosporangium phytohabitans TaxID=860235 RepID=A0A0N9I0M7_9PSEU|nr:ectoine/hydroxyectoine ABC transporter permease subunit EhuC [Kibdelosporangium phytohabitans]ALG13285.1 amino acid ABC transporter permease [Kibdelosporangium phytohabitans]MBE1465060.1 polar amino acid transport system permease protein [Kibdelosporangium phytohabitans]